MQAGSSPAQTEDARRFQGEKSWEVKTIQKGREKAQKGREMAWGKGRLVAGWQVWRAHEEGVAWSDEPACQPWCDPMRLIVVYIASTLLLTGERVSTLCPLANTKVAPSYSEFRKVGPALSPGQVAGRGGLFEKLFHFCSQDLSPDILKVCWEGAAYFIIPHPTPRSLCECLPPFLAAWWAFLNASKKLHHLGSVENVGRLWTQNSFENDEG